MNKNDDYKPITYGRIVTIALACVGIGATAYYLSTIAGELKKIRSSIGNESANWMKKF